MENERNQKLLNFLLEESRRLKSMFSSRERLYHRALCERGPDDSYVVRETEELLIMRNRIIQYEYFINMLELEIGEP